MKETFTYAEIHKILWRLGYSNAQIEKILSNEVNTRDKDSVYVKPEVK